MSLKYGFTPETIDAMSLPRLVMYAFPAGAVPEKFSGLSLAEVTQYRAARRLGRED